MKKQEKYCKIRFTHLPEKQGLYDPEFEHDSCGVGFVCNINGSKSNKIIQKGLEVLVRMTHRGAVGADPKTGDGAGILIQMPHEFLVKVCSKSNINLSGKGEYGSGLIFLPQNKKEREICINAFEKIIKEYKQVFLGWRNVPVNNEVIGETAKSAEPVIKQVFIKKSASIKDTIEFERVLYIIRKRVENIVRESDIKQKSFFYIPSLSSRTLTYKGLLMPCQVQEFFLDLQDKDLESAIALIHSRYSTNTFPTWDLAQPFRILAHNGEINTLRGNINWMYARQGIMKSSEFGNELSKLFPIVVHGGSDSASIDNAVEFLSLSGRSLAHTMMMLIPAAWENNLHLTKEEQDFYEYHANLMEPWDGPAAVVFTDGTQIGAILDRNGLRPARYIITKDDFVVMASEMGVLNIEPSEIKISGRLTPGRMFMIDTKQGRLIEDIELKYDMAAKKPYGEWLKKNLVSLKDIKPESVEKENKLLYKDNKAEYTRILKNFGYTREDLRIIISPMAETGKEPIGSMGDDTPHAVLSSKSRLLYMYFKQMFAQVTNPAIDPIREEIVMSLNSYIGPEQNILEESPNHCVRLKVEDPILFDEELEKIKSINIKGFKTKNISILVNKEKKENFKNVIDRICSESVSAIKHGYTFIVLSDKGVNKNCMALPALLAVGAVHQHLLKNLSRKQISIIVESAEPREVHHFALLFGYGADCINPYLAFEVVKELSSKNYVSHNIPKSLKNFRKAVNKGIFKVLSKMGISTLQSYIGSQIYEALGIGDEVIDTCFTGTPSRIRGVDFDIIQKETEIRHNEAFKEDGYMLSSGGYYQWKKDGEFHLWNPETITLLQQCTRKNDYALYKKFADLINDQSNQPASLRSLMKFKKTNSISAESVEKEEEIVKRFVTGAMSFGSISRDAHETLAVAMNRLKGKSNTGEGGEDTARFIPLPNGDSRRSAVKQVASGRFGVTSNYLTNADEIQIKIAQGAKPGEGGQLPGHKVSVEIAGTRYTTPGVTLISPPPHHDIYSIEDLAQLIFDLKNSNPRARISVKLVSEMGVGTVAAGVAKGHADMILISGADGGTGASPLSSIKYAGLPWELGLSETHQTLVLNDLRSRVRLQTDGQMRTGRDVVIAALLGAEEYGFCTACLIVMGCVMLRHCHLNNCAIGIATQDHILKTKFDGKVDFIINYMKFIAREVREIMAQLGIKTIDELIGRVDLLEVNKDVCSWKSKNIDFSKILYKPKMQGVDTRCTRAQDHSIQTVLDKELIKRSKDALEKDKNVEINMPIKNTDRTTGSMLSGEVCKNFGEHGLVEDTIQCNFNGVAGQSFGAFLAKGITFRLKGIANDYVGKGISGGKIIITPFEDSDYIPKDNIIIGNTTFYGAITGHAYIQGRAGERFCIRNSGLNAVVEGVGDHGCEYMTGGRVVIIGETGRNFAAGMSGGIAYIFDSDGLFKDKCNTEMVEFENLNDEDVLTIRELLHNHKEYTQSPAAKYILENEHKEFKRFIKVIPFEYKRILEQQALEKKLGLDESE
ncbi:glutamate synthase large subunit [bacterium]